ncbi:MAG: hypothetical protein WD638_11860 [Nitriliruptoraceae bacterium]
MLTTDPDRAIDEFRLSVAVGADPLPPAGLPERCQRAVDLAREVGAPLLAALDAAQAARDDERRAERAVAVASAQTRVVAGGLLLAPVLLVPALGRLVGADLLGFYRSGPGLVVLAIGGGMLLVGALIVIVLVRRVGSAPLGRSRHGTGLRPGRPAWILAGIALVVALRIAGPFLAVPVALLVAHLASRRAPSAEAVVGVDEAADLIATALAGGTSGPEALRATADRLPALAPRLRRLAFGLELGLETDHAGPVGPRTKGPGLGRGPGRDPRRGPGRDPGRATRPPAPARDPLWRLAALLAAAERTGAPVAGSVRHLARDLRADDLARVLAAAERLPAQLTFPTALCLLPATVLLIGAPIVHAGLAAVGT